MTSQALIIGLQMFLMMLFGIQTNLETGRHVQAFLSRQSDLRRVRFFATSTCRVLARWSVAELACDRDLCPVSFRRTDARGSVSESAMERPHTQRQDVGRPREASSRQSVRLCLYVLKIFFMVIR